MRIMRVACQLPTLAFVVLVFMSVGRPLWADELANLAAELVKLRSEVETLSADVEMEKAELRDRLRAMAVQKTDLDVQIQKESLRLEQLRQSMTRQKKIIEEAQERGQVIVPVVKRLIGSLERYIGQALPFRKHERLKELQGLSDSLSAGVSVPQKVLARLWTFIEDEFRLTRENGLYRQVIVLEGEEILADVARIGMVMMFFRTEEGRVGHVGRTSEGWVYQAIEDPEAREQIGLLFDAFKKQIRVGYFTLPNALPREEVAP